MSLSKYCFHISCQKLNFVEISMGVCASLIAGIYGSAELPSSAQEFIPAQFYITFVSNRNRVVVRGEIKIAKHPYMFIYVICIVIYRRCIICFQYGSYCWHLMLENQVYN